MTYTNNIRKTRPIYNTRNFKMNNSSSNYCNQASALVGQPQKEVWDDSEWLIPRGNGHYSSTIINYSEPLKCHIDLRLKKKHMYMRTNIRAFPFNRAHIARGDVLDGTHYNANLRCVKCLVLQPRIEFENRAVAKSIRKNNGCNIHCRACVDEMSRASKLYLVDRICNDRVNPSTGINEYLVKWTGYSDLESTWEPRKNLIKLDVFKIYVKKICVKKCAREYRTHTRFIGENCRSTEWRRSTTDISIYNDYSDEEEEEIVRRHTHVFTTVQCIDDIADGGADGEETVVLEITSA
jgi:hypothetical protein